MSPHATDPDHALSSPGDSPEAYVPPPPEGPRTRVRALGLSAPLHWLRLGAQDLIAHPGIGLFYGLGFWTMSMVLALVFRHQPEFTLSMVSGCLLVGPFLAMGLYEVSRRRELGQRPDLGSSLTCWDPHLKSMAMLVLVLLVLELLWGRASLVVFAVFFNTGMPSTTGVVQAIFNPDNLEFLIVYLAVGGVFAGLVFALSVVSIPMILDRDTDAISAALTSVRVFFGEISVILFWGALITVLVWLSLMSPWSVLLLAVGPWLGHASWHAYRASVEWVED